MARCLQLYDHPEGVTIAVKGSLGRKHPGHRCAFSIDHKVIGKELSGLVPRYGIGVKGVIRHILANDTSCLLSFYVESSDIGQAPQVELVPVIITILPRYFASVLE
jgi:hypothetical protein